MGFNDEQINFIKKINKLKQEKNAVILAHNYQRPEIYEIADFIGDSLELCQQASKTKFDLIVFCGVHFMAESAKILNPNKKVIIPNKDAGCAMADMISSIKLQEFQKKHPKAVTVCYVNSTAEIKALSDVCCTSSNAVKIVKALPNKEIIFVPDKNLADFVAKQLPEKKIIAFEGYCPVHNFLTKEYLEEVKESYPNAKIIAHPESQPDVLKKADYVCSTSKMLNCAKKDSASEFFVLTECGMIERLNKALPNKKFMGLCNLCFDMKINTLEAVFDSLEKEKYVVRVDTKIAKKAKKSFEYMFELMNN